MNKKLSPIWRNNPPKMGKITSHTHPLVVFMWREIERRKVTLTSVSDASGIERASIHKWKTSPKGPYLVQLEAVLNALGYKITVEKM